MLDHLGIQCSDVQVSAVFYDRVLAPHRKPARTADGYMTVLPYNDKHWRSFFAAIGEPGRMTQDARFASHTARAA